MYILKRIIYGVSNQIIVTDQARFDLLPTFAQRKAIVVPNVPCIYQPPIEETFERPPDSLTIAYFGTLHEDRGTRFARKLITECPSAVVVCAGWPTDEPSQRLIEHDQVKWLGALPQDEAFRELRNVDYILSIYPSSNLNNLYASPNKIYDAIHTGTPLISSDNFKMVDFINRHRLGYVVPAHLIETPALLVEELKRLKGAFTFDPALARTYCWEHYEQRLIDLHLQSSAPTTNAKSPGSA